MKKGLNFVKQHFSIVAISITAVLLLVGSVTFFNSAKIFSANAGSETLESSSVGDVDEKTIDNIVDSSAETNSSEEETAEELTQSAPRLLAGANPEPLTVDFTQNTTPIAVTIHVMYGGTLEGVVPPGNEMVVPGGASGGKRTDDWEFSTTVTDYINYQFYESTDRFCLDTANFGAYFYVGGEKVYLTQGSGASSFKQLLIPSEIVNADSPDIYLCVPYIVLPDPHKITIQQDSVLNVTFTAASTNSKDKFYTSPTATSGAATAPKTDSTTTSPTYVIAGGQFIISGVSKYLDGGAHSIKSVRVYSADANGDLTVDITDSCLFHNEADNTWTLTMPDEDIFIDIESKSNLKTAEIVVNSPDNKIKSVQVDAGSLYSLNGYRDYGYVFSSTKSAPSSVTLSSNEDHSELSGTVYTYYSNMFNPVYYNFTLSGVGTIATNNIQEYELSDVKVEVLDDNGDVTQTVTDFGDVLSFYGYGKCTGTSSDNYYIQIGQIDANIRITCTFKQMPAYSVYFNEIPAEDGSRLRNTITAYWINEATGNAQYSDLINTYSSINNTPKKVIAGSTLNYSLGVGNTSSLPSWTTLKSIYVYRADENGKKTGDPIDDLLPALRENFYFGGMPYYYMNDIFSMPDYDIFIELEYNESYTPVRVEQYIVGDDGTVTPAGEGFTVNFDSGESDLFKIEDSENLTNQFTATPDADGYYVFGAKLGATNVNFTINDLPEGYIMSGFTFGCNANGYNSGNYFGGNSNDSDKSWVKYQESGKYTISAFNSGYSCAYRLCIYYTQGASMTIAQSTGGVVQPGNTTTLGTITLSRAAVGSTNTITDPFINVVGSATQANANTGTWTAAAFDLLESSEEYSLNVSPGTQLQIAVRPSGERIIKSVAACRINSDGTETELSLTDAGSSYTSATYIVDDVITAGDNIRLSVEYAVADKLKVEVLRMDSATGQLVANDTGATVYVTGSGAITTEGAFQELNSTDYFDDFTVTNSTTVTTIGNTRLNIKVDLPEDSPYVIANVYAYTMDANGNKSGETSEVVPQTAEYDDGSADESVCRDFSNCTFQMPGGSILIQVYLAKVATVNVHFLSKDNQEDVFGPNSVSGTYITFKNTASVYGTKSYPVILTENKYNVESYTVTNDPSERTVLAVEKSTVSGNLSIPKGYVVSSVSVVKTDADGNTSNMGYGFSNHTFTQDELYEAEFRVNGSIEVGCTYDITVNIEKATGIKFNTYHSNENGEFVPNVNVSDCTAILYGERQLEGALYSAAPFAKGRAADDNASNMVGSLTANRSVSSFDYYALTGTTVWLTTTPVTGEVVSEVKVYYENDPNTLLDVQLDSTDADGTQHYSINAKTTASDVLVAEVYFSGDMSGTITIENYVIGGGELGEGCYTYLTLGNNSYPNPIYDNATGKFGKVFTTSAATADYGVMTNSTGSARVYIGAGYILESCEIKYRDGDDFQQVKVYGASSGQQVCVFRTTDFSADKHITIRNTYRPVAKLTIVEYRDLNESLYYAGRYMLTAQNDDESLTNGPIYQTSSYHTQIGQGSSTYNDDNSKATTSGYIVPGSTFSLDVYEEGRGYTFDYYEIFKDGESIAKVYREDLVPKINSQIHYEPDITTEQSMGEGYLVEIHYRADYVDITQESVYEVGGGRYYQFGQVTVSANVSESNPQYDERGDSSYDTSQDVATMYESHEVAGVPYGATEYSVSIVPAGNKLRIKEIWYGETPSTMLQYEDLPYLTWGAGYVFYGLDEFGDVHMRYVKIIYELKYEESEPYEPDEPPVVEPGNGLMTVNAYEKTDDGYQLTTDNTAVITLYGLISDDPIQIYENEQFNAIEGYTISLPYSDSGSVMFCAVEGASIGVTATAKENYRLEKAILVNLSTGASQTLGISKSSNNNFVFTVSGATMRTGNWALNLYFSQPVVELGTNNTVTEHKGSVYVNGTLAIAENEYMKAVKFSSGSNLSVTVIPEEDYEFAYILAGTSRTSMTRVSGNITENDDGSVSIDFGTLTDDLYVQIQFNSIDDTAYSSLNVSHYKIDEAGNAELSTEGTVHTAGVHSFISQPFKIASDSVESFADSFDLTTEGQITVDVAQGTSLQFSVTPPESYYISDFKAMYYDADGNAVEMEFNRSGNTFTLPQTVILNTTIFVEVYYTGGYQVFYHSSGHTGGTAPSDGTIYYSGQQAVVLGQGDLVREHYEFLGWSLTSSGTVDYVEGDKISFGSGNDEDEEEITFSQDVHLYAVWQEETKYNIIYHANGGDGSAPIDNNSYYLNQDAVVLGNIGNPPLSKTGYTFAGWNMQSDGEGTAYQPGNTLTITESKLTITEGATTKAVHLYAVWTEKSYKLTYNKNTTDEVTDMPDPLTVSWNYTEAGEQISLDENTPKRTGYEFTGWNTPADGQGTTTYQPGAQFTKIAEDVTLYAQWDPIACYVTYKDGYTNNSQNDVAYKVDYDGEHVVLDNMFTRVGWTFNGWSVTPDSYSTVIGDTITVKGNVTYTAQWIQNNYTVTYVVTGTVPEGLIGVPLSKNYHYGDIVDVAAEPSGYDTKQYTFSGWTSTDVDVTNGSFSMPTKNVTITGTFTENDKANLIYMPNGGEPTDGVPDSVADYPEFSATVEAPKVGFARTGYTFTGWNTKSDGSGDDYSAGDTITISVDTYLYAQWSINEYAVTYTAGYTGSGQNDVIYKMNYGEGHQVQPNTFTREGWTFNGWSVTPASYSTVVGDTITVESNVTYTAQWIPNKHTVSYNVTGADLVGYDAPDPKQYDYGYEVTVEPIPSSGDYDTNSYRFEGWTIVSGITDVDITDGKFTMPDNDVVFEGKFTAKNMITLSYNANGGAPDSALPPSETAEDELNTTVGSGSGLSMEGHHFTGWNTKADGFGTAYAAGDPITITENTTLYAQWAINSFDVEYYEENGTDKIGTVSYNYEATVTVGEGVIAPEVIGKTFSHWELIDSAQKDASGALIGRNSQFRMPAETVKYKAVYDDIKYTVTYKATGNIPDGYNPPIDSTEYYYNNLVNVAAVPTADGYTFEGWTYNGNNESYNGKIYAAGTDNSSFQITENVTLVGVWTKNAPVPTITVTYQSGVDCEDTNDPLAKSHSFNSAVNADYTVLDNIWYDRPGYTFKNWVVVEPKVTGISLIDSIVAFFAGPANIGQEFVGGDIITALSEDITLEAQWEEIKYTVTYYENGATGGTAPVDDNSYVYKDIVTVRDKGDLVKEFFDFVEWNTNPLGTGTSYSTNSTFEITSDVKLYAIWRAEPAPNAYKVIYDGNGSTSGAAPKDYTDYMGGETVTVKDKGTLAKDGCTFKEWNTKPNGKGTGYNADDTFTMPESDVTLYAIWVDSNGKIVYSPGTGESAVGVQIAVGVMLLSILAGAYAVITMRRKRRKCQ